MSSGLLSLKWNNHSSTFLNLLTTLRNKDCYCDATLACDGNFYSVHKLVLSTCSEYFDEVFSQTQCKHPVIILKDMKAEEIEALLNYMYIGEVNVLQDKLTGLIKAAEALKIKGLAVPDDPPSSKNTVSEGKREHSSSHCSQSAKRSRRSEHGERRPELPEAHKERGGGIFTRNLLEDDSEQYPVSRGADVVPDEDRHGANQISSDNDRWPVGRSVTQEDGHEESSRESHESGGHNRDGGTSQVVEVKMEPLHQEDEDASELIDSKENITKSDNYNFNSVDSSRGSEDLALGDTGGTSSGNYLDTILQDQSQSVVDDTLNQPGPSGLQASQWDSDTNLAGLEGFTSSSQNNQSSETFLASSSRSAAAEDIKGSHPQVYHHFLQHSEGLRRWKTESLVTPVLLQDSTLKKRIHQCSFCSYTTAFTTNLAAHLRTHTGEKPYPCPFCKYRATTAGNLKSHVRTHTGERPFNCPYCDYKTGTKWNLQSHLKTHFMKPCHTD